LPPLTGQLLQPQLQPPLPFSVRSNRLPAKKTATATMRITIMVWFIMMLVYINSEPIWKNRVLAIHARPMVYTTVKRAHFHLPLSFLMATMVETQGI